MASRSTFRQMSAHARGTPAEMRADVVRWRNISIGTASLSEFPSRPRIDILTVMSYSNSVRNVLTNLASICNLLHL